MDFISSILSAILFVAFVPGVLVTLPSKSSPQKTIIAVHAVLFTVVTTFVMRYYWVNIKGYIESMSNFGTTCPNGFVPQGNDCVPSGRATYDPGSGQVPTPTETSA
jgi:hypothetical protein